MIGKYMFIFKGADDFMLHTQTYNANYLYVTQELRRENIDRFAREFGEKTGYDCIGIAELI